MTDSIYARRRELERARRDMQAELMREYDNRVYKPAMDLLYTDCETEGHCEGPVHNNGFGWTFISCSKCGKTIKKIGPED